MSSEANVFDWIDSDYEKCFSQLPNIDEKSAADEPAWKGVKDVRGLKIWRIVNFQIEDWPKEIYGQFYSGDTYIVLNAVEEGKEVVRDIHIWIGRGSSQDEYGTAAYKMVELDTCFGGSATQHREVQGLESNRFVRYFNYFALLNGGAESGFNHVDREKERMPTRLYKLFFDGDAVSAREMPLSRGRLASSSIYLLSTDEKLLVWYGKDSEEADRYKAVVYADKMSSVPKSRQVKPVDEGTDASNEFNSYLLDEDVPDGYDMSFYITTETESKSVYRLTDCSGKLEFIEIDASKVTSVADLKNEDIYIIDTPFHCYVWIGSGSSRNEKRNALIYAHRMLRKGNHPGVPVTVVLEGRYDPGFEAAVKI